MFLTKIRNFAPSKCDCWRRRPAGRSTRIILKHTSLRRRKRSEASYKAVHDTNPTWCRWFLATNCWTWKSFADFQLWGSSQWYLSALVVICLLGHLFDPTFSLIAAWRCVKGSLRAWHCEALQELSKRASLELFSKRFTLPYTTQLCRSFEVWSYVWTVFWSQKVYGQWSAKHQIRRHWTKWQLGYTLTTFGMDDTTAIVAMTHGLQRWSSVIKKHGRQKWPKNGPFWAVMWKQHGARKSWNILKLLPSITYVYTMYICIILYIVTNLWK